jgi:hypothetical protein
MQQDDMLQSHREGYIRQRFAVPALTYRPVLCLALRCGMQAGRLNNSRCHPDRQQEGVIRLRSWQSKPTGLCVLVGLTDHRCLRPPLPCCLPSGVHPQGAAGRGVLQQQGGAKAHAEKGTHARPLPVESPACQSPSSSYLQKGSRSMCDV